MSSKQLDYAPPPPLYRRKTFRRWLTGIALLAVCVSGIWWEPPLRRRFELLYWQNRCMAYTPSDGLVAIAAKDRSVTARSNPREWSEFNSKLPTPLPASDAIAFMHELRKPNGERRIVVLEMRGDGDFIGRSEYAAARVLSPGNFTRAPREIVQSHRGWEGFGIRIYVDNINPGTIYAGKVDATDPSHFTVRMILGTQEIIYDGRLRDDDTVGITARDPTEIKN